jgi:hypothetical protein
LLLGDISHLSRRVVVTSRNQHIAARILHQDAGLRLILPRREKDPAQRQGEDRSRNHQKQLQVAEEGLHEEKKRHLGRGRSRGDTSWPFYLVTYQGDHLSWICAISTYDRF